MNTLAWVLMWLAVGIPLTIALVAWLLPKPRCRHCRKRIDALWLPDGICSGCRVVERARARFRRGVYSSNGYNDD